MPRRSQRGGAAGAAGTSSSTSEGELLRLLEEAWAETRGCIGEDEAEELVDCGLRGEGIATIVVDDVRVLLPCSELPEAWFNLSHVFCTRDYAVLEGFEPREGWVVVDAGAYLGFYTLFAASRVGAEGLVVAVEPLARHRRIIEEAIELNGFEDRVRLDPRALYSERGVHELIVSCYGATSSLLREHVERHGETCGSVRVATVTLPELLEEHGLDRVDLLKVDVEGAELAALSVPGWERRIERLVVEVHLDVVDPWEVAWLLRGRGYRVAVAPIRSETQLMLYAWRGGEESG